MSQRRLVLKNSIGETTRNMPWPDGEQAFVVLRKDLRRMEVIPKLEVYEEKNIEFDLVQKISVQELEQGVVKLGESNTLELVTEVGTLMRNIAEAPYDRSPSNVSRIVSSAILVLFFSLFFLQQDLEIVEEEVVEPELVVKIAPKEPPKKVELVDRANAIRTQTTTTKPTTTNISKNVKRMGALSVLGRSTKSNQKGGLNLGSAQTTRGAGLGGTGGSGGVQTSLYGKGLVNAPVGPGSNLQGGGGYGTKGRGGGQDGYGQLQLTGSAGGNPIPLGREAIVSGGIDKALIADVVNRNKGQVRFCYEQELQADPRLAGRVVVAWVIGNDGRVSNARIHSSTLHSRNVEECILTRLRTWRFPLPEGEGNVDVNFPFLLEKRS